MPVWWDGAYRGSGAVFALFCAAICFWIRERDCFPTALETFHTIDLKMAIGSAYCHLNAAVTFWAEVDKRQITMDYRDGGCLAGIEQPGFKTNPNRISPRYGLLPAEFPTTSCHISRNHSHCTIRQFCAIRQARCGYSLRTPRNSIQSR